MQSLGTIIRPPATGSWLGNLLRLPRAQAEKFIKALTEEEAFALENDWLFKARAAQYWPEGNWRLWAIIAGRGFGKTRPGAEWVKHNAMALGVKRQILVAPTNGDLRKTMIEGESGILAVCPEARYNQQRQTVFFPNGCIAEGFSAEEPERLRGPQGEKAWCDEVAAWQYDQDTWDMMEFALRLGDNPQILVTTTPKPRPLIQAIIEEADHITGGSTYENADNLAPSYLAAIKRKYEGTRLGQQEIFAKLLEDVQGALWKRELIKYSKSDDYLRKVVAIDPAVTNTDESDECGIVIGGKGADGKGRVIGDFSGRMSPLEWANRAVNLFHAHSCDLIVAETNNGGDLVETVLRTVDPRIPFKKVTASRGKRTRAEPISSLYEQGRIEHEKPFDELEDQMCNWVPDSGMKSPDRMDAMVWCMTELMLGAEWHYGIY
jgi:predicted phage terminase large subunit-like protein